MRTNLNCSERPGNFDCAPLIVHYVILPQHNMRRVHGQSSDTVPPSPGVSVSCCLSICRPIPCNPFHDMYVVCLISSHIQDFSISGCFKFDFGMRLIIHINLCHFCRHTNCLTDETDEIHQHSCPTPFNQYRIMSWQLWMTNSVSKSLIDLR